MSDSSYLAFDPAWFKKHQRPLLWLLNSPGTKSIFRHCLGIRYPGPIVDIKPNCFTFDRKLIWQNGKPRIQQTTDFRTRPQFARNLYRSLKPLWWGMHLYDELFADRFAPQLSFGFSTLTKSPQAGSGGSNVSVDGSMLNGNIASWASLIGAANATAVSATENQQQVAGFTHNSGSNYTNLYRGVFTFDTSSLGSGVAISAATLSLSGYSKTDQMGCAPNIDIYTWNGANANAIVVGDFSQCGSTSQTGAPITYASWLTGGSYNPFTFSIFSNISKTGVSKFCSRNANYDVTGSIPSDVSVYDISCLTAYFADYGGGTYAPNLVVTYGIAAPAGVPVVFVVT